MKRDLYINQRYILTSMLLTLCVSLMAQNRTAFTSRGQENRSQQIRTTLTSSDTVTLEGMGIIYSLSIDATICQPREASFTRIVLEDTDGHDYLVAESDWFRFDSTTVHLDRYCEETALLEGITPFRLKCYLAGDATITLNGIHSSNQPVTRKGESPGETAESIKLTQVQDIVNRINDYNRRHGKIWEAGVTNYSKTFYDKQKKTSVKKSERNIYENDPYIANLIYYVGGIYEMGERQERALNRDSSLYVPSFSWTNRHGSNWMTAPKDQGGSHWCEMFATCSAIEALVNLQFNRHLDMDLSEKDLAFNNHQPYGQDALYGGAGIRVAKDSGIVNDDGAPLDTVYSSRPTGNELIQFSSYAGYDPRVYGTEDVKGIILNYGPCVGGTLTHAMALIGWGRATMDDVYTVYGNGEHHCQVDSSLIGEEYWIFKDSHYQAPDPNPEPKYGTHPGYLHVIFHDTSYFYIVFYVDSPITSLNYSTEDILCEDSDGDGLYNWGIGNNKPPHCPAWASNDSDGDDSDPTKGHMNEYGSCEELAPDHPVYEYISNDSTLVCPENRTSYLGVLRGATVTIQAQQTFYNGTKLLLDKGATLIIDATTINGNSIQPYAGSKIILNNGAKILKPFNVPIGVEFIINKGSIE